METALKQLHPTVSHQVTWAPFQLRPDAPLKGENKLEMYRKKFGEARMAQMIPHMKSVGAACGINFSYGGVVGNTLRSHRLVAWAGKQNKMDAMVENLFKFYFEQEQDITDIDTLVRCAELSGLDAAAAKTFLNSDELVAETAKEIASVGSSGVSGVPFFIFNNKLSFSGGQPPEAFLQVFKKLGLPLSDKL
jgi:predicted DsbA family dithiol-disulfide isomerase